MNLWLEKLIPWAAKNRTKIYNFECILHAFVGFFLVFLSYQIGHKHINLLQNGVKAWGIVVDYKQEAFVTNSGFSNTVKDHKNIFVRIIEFKVGDRLMRFRDWIGSESNYSSQVSVPIIYNPSDPSIALIDRPIINWLLWAPICLIGLFLMLVSVKNLFKSILINLEQ